MHLFHIPRIEGDLVELPAAEAHHAAHVLRLLGGQRIGLLDGIGTRATAVLTEVSKRRVVAEVIELHREGPERIARIHLAVAPTKQLDRYEWLVEKAVETGVDRITPVRTARTERKALRIDRLRGVMVAAMKQSQRAWLPELDEMTNLEDLLRQPMPPQRFFGWCEGLHGPLAKAYDPDKDAIVLIGPEGDFSPDEAALLRHVGFSAVGLGTARLRTETAGLVACAWMNLKQQG